MKITGLLFLTLLLLTSHPVLDAQHRVERPVGSSAGGWSSSGGYRVGGTLSQSAAGLLQRDSGLAGIGLARVGFWHRPSVEATAVVRIPEISAEVGTRLTIPVILESSERLLHYGPRSFRLRLRFNRTLLDPDPLSTPPCVLEGGDCVMEITGRVEGILSDTIARLEFTALLGDAEATPLAIDTIEWEERGERRFRAERTNGLFTLLGVCREGGQIRLIHTGAPAGRLSILPNVTQGSTTLEFLSPESLPVRITLVDALGREQRVLVNADAESSRLYRIGIDLSDLATGGYFVVMQAGETRLIERVNIR